MLRIGVEKYKNSESRTGGEKIQERRIQAEVTRFDI